MTALLLALYMHGLLPVQAQTKEKWEREWLYRLQLAEAISQATSDPGRQLLLARLARFESSYREDVGRCRLNGKAGDRTAFQIVARNDAERARLCVSLADDARFALERINESLTACRKLPAAERLAVYARGSCASEEGRKLSRHRWPSASEVASYERALRPEGDADGSAAVVHAAE